MTDRKQRLMLQQADRKLEPFQQLLHAPMPSEGWINTVRTAINMSLRQLGNKLGISAQGVKGLETNEKNGTISLRSLNEMARALDMKLVYGFVPMDGSLDEMVSRKAESMAREIVNRTSHTMRLEDQAPPAAFLEKALAEKKNEIKNEMPKLLWE